MTAAYKGNLEVISALKEINDIDPNIPNKDGDTPLMWAVKNGNVEVIRALKEIKNIKPNIPNKDGDTPLMWAVKNGKVEVIRALQEVQGIDPNIPNKDGDTALTWAAKNGELRAIQALKEIKDIDPNIKKKDGHTALMEAAKNGKIQNVRTLLAEFPNIEIPARMPRGVTPEIRSIIRSYTKNPQQWLLNNGASAETIYTHITEHDTKLNTKEKQQLLKLAAKEGKVDIIIQVVNQKPQNTSYLNNQDLFDAIVTCLFDPSRQEEINPRDTINIIVKFEQASKSSWFSKLDKSKIKTHYDDAVKLLGGYSNKRRELSLNNDAELPKETTGKLLKHAVLHQDFATLEKIVEIGKNNKNDITGFYGNNKDFKVKLEKYTKSVIKELTDPQYTPERRGEILTVLQELGGGSEGKIFSEATNTQITNELNKIPKDTIDKAKKIVGAEGSKLQGLASIVEDHGVSAPYRGGRGKAQTRTP
jgi:ankyrin repeat protein